MRSPCKRVILAFAIALACFMAAGCRAGPAAASATESTQPDITQAETTVSQATAGQGISSALAAEDKNGVCTLSVSCATILDNLDSLDAEKSGLIPADGWILPPLEVGLVGEESVFDILQKTLKQLKIHMEFVNTPMYGNAYIEGIGNIYEFDCGELSGWTYRVNGEFPGFGCSQYTVQCGDVIEWLYTCDLGRDVGAPLGD